MSVIGFDFGNLNSVIAVARRGGIDIIINEVSNRQTPSMVSFGSKERYLGEPALPQLTTNPKNTVRNFKRLLGRKFNEADVQKELSFLPVKSQVLPDGGIEFELQYLNETKTFSAEQIASMLFQKLKITSEAELKITVTDCVISVPGYWSDRQRRALLSASKIAGLNCLRIINELTATALTWGIFKSDLPPEETPLQVLFIDVGQSNFSVELVNFSKGKMRVVSSAYDPNLGGRDFDLALVEHFANEFKTKYKIDVKSNPRALVRLEVACEKLKKVLSANPEAPLNIECLMNDIDVKGVLTRADFEVLSKDLLDKMLIPIQKVLEDANLKPEQVPIIEVVGGGSRVPIVMKKVSEFFGKEAQATLNREESVAKGCAMMCAILSPSFKTKEFSIIDANVHPINISWHSVGVDAMEQDAAELFARNAPVPSQKLITLNKSAPFELVISYGDSEYLPKDFDHSIGKFVVDVPSKDGKPQKIKVKIKLDNNGIVYVDSAQLVEDVAEPTPDSTGSTPTPNPNTTPAETSEADTKRMDTSPDGPVKTEESKPKKTRRIDIPVQSILQQIPEVQLNLYLEEEGKMAANDKLAKETAEKKNYLESYVYDMRNKLSTSLSEFEKENIKADFNRILEETEEWLYGEGEDASKGVYVEKLTQLQKFGAPIEARKRESEELPWAFEQLRKIAEHYRAQIKDPKFDHIEQVEKDKIISALQSAETEFQKLISDQQSRPKYEDPNIIHSSTIYKKKQELETSSNQILSKPKPVPKPEPQPTPPPAEPESAPEATKSAENNQPTPQPESSSKMDLD